MVRNDMKRKYYNWHEPEIGYIDIIELFLDSYIILDAGCGSGWVGKLLKKNKSDVTVIGLDIDIVGLRKAKNCEIPILSNTEHIPLKDNTIDGIVAKDLLEHSTHPHLIMLEFNRILKKRGMLYISVPDVKSKTFWDDYTHVRPYNKKSLVSLVEDTGFSINKLWYTGNFKGLGVLMSLLHLNKTPNIMKELAKIGINRQNIHIVANID